MKNIKYLAQRYVDWLTQLGRLKFSLLGVALLAVFALCIQILLSIFIVGDIYWIDITRSVIFGLMSAPFVIYFFALLVERLERSRRKLAKSVTNLRNEISERISAERKLSQALDELEQNNRDKSTLMATISHELRTPLNGIIGLSRILLDGKLNDEQRNYLKTINVSAISLSHIFNDIIDLEKIDAQRIELVRSETDFYSLLSDIRNFATLMTEQKSLEFEMLYDGDLPHWLLLDRTRLSQILWNLISNAVKFTEQGKITLTIQRLSINEYSFSLSDTGIGIPQQDLDNIFAMYYQVQSKSNSYKNLGSGIGLAISKQIAGLMGGDLLASSELGVGSTFTLTIKAEEVIKPILSEARHIGLNLKILLVEDIEVNIIVAKSVLEKLGYQVDVAMTGSEAIEKFEKNHYDLLLLDIQLPDMSGFDIAQYLRANYQQDKYDFLPPLIALTANVKQDKKEYQRQGMDDVLGKPLSVDELNHCLLNYFSDIEETQPTAMSIPHQVMSFNQEYLEELINMLGLDFVQKNLNLFEQAMGEYVQELKNLHQTFVTNPTMRQALASQAHKIKGAAASIGLTAIQDIAQLAQQQELPTWQQNIAHWVQQIEQNWQPTLQELKQWLSRQNQGL